MFRQGQERSAPRIRIFSRLPRDQEEIQSHPISVWLCSPNMDPESMGVAMQFPITWNRIQEVIEEFPHGLDVVWLTEVATQPQLSEHYGSIILLPKWVLQSDPKAVLVDARQVGGGVFPFYLSRPITRYLV